MDRPEPGRPGAKVVFKAGLSGDDRTNVPLHVTPEPKPKPSDSGGQDRKFNQRINAPNLDASAAAAALLPTKALKHL